MRKLIYITPILLAACAAQPEPLCDREAQLWDKYGTQEDECARPVVPVYAPTVPTGGEPRDPKSPPPDCDCDKPPHEPPSEPPYEPPSEPPHEPPTYEKVKGNNGLGNGDQRAPGNSLTRNKAENEVGNPGHKSGKAQKSD